MAEFKASWVEVPNDCDFSIANIPFGVYRAADGSGHIATAIGAFVSSPALQLRANLDIGMHAH